MYSPVFPRKPRPRRSRRRVEAVPSAPAALTLVEATYDDLVPSIRLGFDRAIDIAGLVGTQIVVDDSNLDLRYRATGMAMLVDPNTVEIVLVAIGSAGESGWKLTASAATGIVAVELPFP